MGILNDKYRRVQIKAPEALAMYGNAVIMTVAVKNQINTILGGYGVVAALEYWSVDTFLFLGRG